jgi:ATP-dependent exoDNAse (exonuclease V) beta subunit
VEELQLRVVLDEALQTVEAVARAAFWEKARTSEHQVEVPFCVGAPTPGGQPSLTSGVVDLVHRVGDHWNVIDYKTDRGGLPATTQYDAQLRAYREMWAKMTGGDVRAELVRTRTTLPTAGE